MKSSLLSLASALVLVVSASNLAQATPASAGVASHEDGKRRNDSDKRYDNDRRLSPSEKARLEALRRKNDRRDDRRDNDRRDNDRREDRRGNDRRDNDRDYRQGQDFNYGYSKNHRVTPAEKARWEAQHRNDRH